MYEPNDLIVTTDTTLRGITAGMVQVLDKAILVIEGAHAGSVHLDLGTRLIVTGQLSGQVDVSDEATVQIQGSIAGPVNVRQGGSVAVESLGSLAGPLVNWGVVRNYGKRAGPIEGGGVLVDEPGSTVIQPTIGVDGSNHYSV